jgi:hypothetical protein
VSAASASRRFLLNLGAPIALSATGVCAAQARRRRERQHDHQRRERDLRHGLLRRAARGVIVSSNAGDTTQTAPCAARTSTARRCPRPSPRTARPRVNGKKAFFKITQIAVQRQHRRQHLGGHDGHPRPAGALYGAGYVLKEIQTAPRRPPARSSRPRS